MGRIGSIKIDWHGGRRHEYDVNRNMMLQINSHWYITLNVKVILAFHKVPVSAKGIVNAPMST